MTGSSLRRFARKAGLDEQVLPTLLFRGWSVLAGAALIFLLPIWLSPIEQGFYYTFASVLALQIFFELGLSQVVVQLVGKETAHLALTDDQRLSGDPVRLGRLASLARLLRKWYSLAAVLFAIACGLAGAVFFSQTSQLVWTRWLGVWSLLVVCTAINLSFLPRLALMEGAGQVGKVARLRLMQAVVGYAFLMPVLALGGGLWVATVIPCVTVVFTFLWLRQNGKLFEWLANADFKPEHAIAWKQDVLPFQWRIAVSWMSGFFIFQLFMPIVFAQRGAAEAGRLGMAMTVFSAISTIGMSWVNAKTPSFSMHISRGERHTLNLLFKAVCIRSLAFTASMCALVVIISSALAANHFSFMARVADPLVLLLLAIVCTLNTLVFAAAAFMRAHGEEPMLAQSIGMGICTIGVVYFGSPFGIVSMIAMYAGITLLISLPWTAWLFTGYYRRNT